MIEELKFLGKFTFFFFGGSVRGLGVGLGGQGGCDRRIEAFVKIQNYYYYFFFFLGGGGGGEGVGLVVRVDVIEELKFLGKFTKNWWGGRGGRLGRVGGGGGGQCGCE